jgi:hypothetical protein
MKEPGLGTHVAAECVESSTGAIPNIFAGHFTQPVGCCKPRSGAAGDSGLACAGWQYNGVQGSSHDP